MTRASATNPYLDGYAVGADYAHAWQREMAPAWLDHVSAHGGLAPPRRRPSSAFRYCELGCGLGWTLNLLAAANPHARFLGIDAIAGQVRHAREVARSAGIDNVEFRAQTFEQALRGRHRPFDYVAAHGVYTWVSDDNAARLFEFARRFLAPRGLLYLGYNVEPGWSALRPVQKLMQLAATARPERTAQAGAAAGLSLLQALRDAGARRLQLPAAAERLLDRLREMPLGYVVHEFQHSTWRPVFVTEASARAADAGLALAGSTRLGELRPDFVLRRAQRAIVDAADSPAERELLTDLCLGRSFRTDVFARAARRPRPGATWQRRMAAVYGLARPRPEVRYEVSTPGGRLRFDNRAARLLVRALAGGPGSATDVGRRADAGGVTGADLLNVLDALLAADAVVPLDPAREAPAAARLNALICERVAAGRAVPAQVTRHGVAVYVPSGDLAVLRAGGGRRARERALTAHLAATGPDQPPGSAALPSRLRAFERSARLLRLLGVA